MKFKYQILLSILSGIILALSFPNANLEPLAFAGLVPLFIAVYFAKTAKRAMLLSYLTGVVFYTVVVYWLSYVSPILMFVVFYGGIYFLIFGYIVKRLFNLPKKNDALFIILVPSAWVVTEYLRNYLLTGLNWALVGYSQYLSRVFIQIADIGGVYIVSFFVVLVNYAIFIFIREKFLKPSDKFINAKKAVIIAIVGVLFVAGYGIFRLSEKIDGINVKLSVLQGNIPLEWYWSSSPDKHKLIMDKYILLTKEAAKEKPELIIWPETSVPGFLEENPDIHDAIKKLSKELDMPLLIGSPTLTLGKYAERLYNSVILQKKGAELERYSKLHLVPFGEYIPMETNLYFIRKIIPQPIGEYSPGSKYTIFPLKEGVDFGVVICFEDMFPNLVNNFIKKGARFMVNITNDEWFMESSAPYQHAQGSVFRAVENRINVVRAANTGLSCFIDPKGKIFAKVQDKTGKDIFVEGYKTAEITVSKKRSFYASCGDIFAIICLFFSVIFFLKIFVFRKQ